MSEACCGPQCNAPAQLWRHWSTRSPLACSVRHSRQQQLRLQLFLRRQLLHVSARRGRCSKRLGRCSRVQHVQHHRCGERPALSSLPCTHRARCFCVATGLCRPCRRRPADVLRLAARTRAMRPHRPIAARPLASCSARHCGVLCRHVRRLPRSVPAVCVLVWRGVVSVRRFIAAVVLGRAFTKRGCRDIVRCSAASHATPPARPGRLQRAGEHVLPHGGLLLARGRDVPLSAGVGWPLRRHLRFHL